MNRVAKLLCSLLLLLSGLVQAETELSESQIKAAYLYKFFAYVEWPATRRQAPLAIGVLDADEVAADLEILSRELIANDYPFQVKRLRSDAITDQVDILFIGKAAMAKKLLSSPAAMPVLTVTERNEGLPSGSIINFVVVDQRIRFEISLTQAKRVNLNVSSRLLSLALRVEREDLQQ